MPLATPNDATLRARVRHFCARLAQAGEAIFRVLPSHNMVR